MLLWEVLILMSLMILITLKMGDQQVVFNMVSRFLENEDPKMIIGVVILTASIVINSIFLILLCILILNKNIAEVLMVK